jgi:NADH-quinone oxidoreductase subunit L
MQDSHSLNNFLSAVWPAAEAHSISHETEYMLALFAIGAAALGLGAAYHCYVQRPDLPGRVAARLSAVYALSREKYYLDEVYDAAIVRPLVKLSDAVLYRSVDAGLIDGVAVNGTARAVRAIAANGLKYVQSGLAQAYVVTMIIGAVAILGYLLR